MKAFFIALVSAVCLLAGCTDGGEFEGFSEDTYKVSATLDATPILPQAPVDASKGTVTGWYDEQSNSLAFNFKYTKDVSVVKKDTLVNVLMYRGKTEVGSTSPARSFAFNLVVDATQTTPANVTGSLNFGLSGATAFKSDEKADFKAGQWYLVLVSKRFPKGVMAGNLVVEKNN